MLAWAAQQFNVALGDGVDSFLWNGPWDFPQIGGINFFPNDLETPDLNGDGFPDIVSSSSHSSPEQNQARGIIALISKPDVSANRGSIDFPETPVGQVSPVETVTVSVGPGPSAGFISSDFSIEGTGDTNFDLTTDCPGTVASGETCDVNVTFAPAVDGQHNPDLKIKTPDGGTITIPLSGVTGHEDLTVDTPEGERLGVPGRGSGQRAGLRGGIDRDLAGSGHRHLCLRRVRGGPGSMGGHRPEQLRDDARTRRNLRVPGLFQPQASRIRDLR